MATVIFDYSKCEGVGECVEQCPVEILELSENENWCKPIDDKVENQEAVDEFHDQVEEKGSADVTIENEMPECVACMVCQEICPQDAITVEE